MNYLAHFVLSDPETLIGNFVGDFVKGRKAMDALSEDLRRGVILHRAIDDFTDNHQIFRRSVSILRPYFGHYAGVAADMYYDFFLARDFKDWTGEPLSSFSQDCYVRLREEKGRMPERAAFVCERMIEYDWLMTYETPEGLGRTFRGLAKRTKFESGLERGQEILERHMDALEIDFRAFFPEAIRFHQDFDPARA